MQAAHALGCGHTPGERNRLGFERAEKVIETFEPASFAEFRRVTSVLLRRFRSDDSWSNGLLNRNGAPIEFAFATFSDQLRYTAELGGDELPPEQRLRAAEAAIEQLGGPRLAAQRLQQFRASQRGMSLGWGAWLGVRHVGATTTFKIYVEADSQAWSSVLPAAGVAAHLQMIGWSPHSERLEYYFEFSNTGLRVPELRELLRAVGLADRIEALLSVLRALEFRSESSADDALAQSQLGFSYSTLPDGREPVFALFVMARDLAGGDGIVRRQLAITAKRYGWRLGSYLAITEPLCERYFRSAYHNMVSFVVGPAPLAGIQVSVSPPPAGLANSI